MKTATKHTTSKRFGDLSVIINGVHFFPDDLKKEEGVWITQGVFPSGPKYRQDTYTVSAAVAGILKKYQKPKN